MGFFKTLFFLIILLGILAAGGFYGLPFLEQHYLAPLSRESQDLADRVKVLEEFVQIQKEERDRASLPPDADFPAVVGQVNGLAGQVRSMAEGLVEEKEARREFEDRLAKRLDEMVAESNTLVRQELESLSASLEKDREDVRGLVNSVERGVTILRAAQTLSGVMGYLVKVKSDLQSRNAGKALIELALVEKRLEEIGQDISEGEEAALIQSSLQAVRAVRKDIDEGNPTVVDRIDLLWNDLERLSLLFLKEGPKPAEKVESATPSKP